MAALAGGWRGRGTWEVEGEQRILTLESIGAPIRPGTAAVARQEPDEGLNQRRKLTRVARRPLKHSQW